MVCLLWCVLFVVRRVRLLFAVFVICCLLSVVPRVLSIVGVSLAVILVCIVLCWCICDECRCLLSFLLFK